MPPVRELLPEGALDQAYAAQEINTKRWLDAGRRLVGRKIGLTSLAVQKQLGVDQPDYGMLFDDMAVPDGWEIGAQAVDPAQGRSGSRLSCSGAISITSASPSPTFCARLTLPCPRSKSWIRASPTGRSAYSTPSPTMPRRASMCSAATPKKLKDLDLRMAGMVMESAGEPVSVGAGAACLGDPLSAVLWLAKTMAQRRASAEGGRHGVVGRARPDGRRSNGVKCLKRGSQGLGSVRAAFAKEQA